MVDQVEFARAVRSAEPDEAHRLRHDAQAWLAGLAMGDEDRERAVAAVSEAVENAVEHAYPAGAAGTVELTLVAEREAITIRVVDHGRWVEHAMPPAAPGSHAARGRGIVLMHRSVDSVSIRHTDDGTTVALRLER